MANNRLLIIFGILFTVAAAGLFLLYASLETERALRIQREREIAGKAEELAQIQQQLTTLTNLRNEIENTLNSKIDALGAELKSEQGRGKEQAEEVRRLTNDRKSLQNDKERLEKKVAELQERVQTLEREKKKLETSLEDARVASRSQDWGDEEDEVGDEVEPASPVKVPASLSSGEPVELGEIVILKSTGAAATVQTVNPVYGFIIVNAGSESGLEKDSVINIVRGSQVIGKAVVEKARPHLSAAVLLPESSKKEIRVGDLISR